MRHLFLIVLIIGASHAAWSQGSASNGQAPTPGAGTAVTSTIPGGGGGVPIPESSFRAQCLTNLSAFASEKLQAQLLKDKAVTQQVRSNAKIGDGGLGASCNKLCDDYALVSSKISWAHMSPGFLSEPEHTLQKVYGALPKPNLPGKTELDTCLPQQATLNWCPPAGSGVGAGPSRIENPLDKIKVCITGGEALQHMNFTVADTARNCARPSIADAAERIKTEHACIADAVKSEQKADADKLAANALSQIPKASMGVKLTARPKP